MTPSAPRAEAELDAEEEEEEEAPPVEPDLNMMRLQAQDLKPFYWTVDKVHHKIGGQPDQARQSKRGGAVEPRAADMPEAPPSPRTRKPRRS